MSWIFHFACGLLMAFGLGVSGMTDPSKVKGFLDVTGAWNPALAFVMAGALAVNILMHQIAARRKKPLLDQDFFKPSRVSIDWRLIAGSAAFGVGWGLGGYCPGPGLVSLAALTGGQFGPLVFVAGMIAGMWAFKVKKI
ncbi:MAG: hypothetical protein RIQ81_30 [Pseudomonadota bacterium]